MDTNALKKFAAAARTLLIDQVAAVVLLVGPGKLGNLNFVPELAKDAVHPVLIVAPKAPAFMYLSCQIAGRFGR